MYLLKRPDIEILKFIPQIRFLETYTDWFKVVNDDTAPLATV